jgi:nitrite reductase/ring-hydroxylating ferredoxin subunit
MPQDRQYICQASYVSAGCARNIEVRVDGEALNLIVWNQGSDTTPDYKIFQNSCPHLSMPLETFPDRLLSEDKTALICSTHGALFNKSGLCFKGPCEGQSLRLVAFTINEQFELVLTPELNHS